MQRFAAGVSATGLGLMSSVALLLCSSPTFSLESRVVVFLAGIVLFVLGGSGYTAMQRQAVRLDR